MATLAKILGVTCIILAVIAACDALFRVAAVDWSSDGEAFAELGTALAALIIGAEVAVGVLLATVGASAYVVADQAEAADRDRRAAWERYQAARPPDRPYGASSRT